ncbi:MAG: ORF6N domain-containing protein [Nitrospirae bacterium YQR-1]
MSNLSATLKIEGKEVTQIIYKSKPVITLQTINELHERKTGTAEKNFTTNKARFNENEDYFNVPYQEWKSMVKSFPPSQKFDTHKRGGHRGSMIFLTESGYLLLVKSFTDELSWKIQRALVNSYFTVKTLTIQKNPDSLVVETEALKKRNKELEEKVKALEKEKPDPKFMEIWLEGDVAVVKWIHGEAKFNIEAINLFMKAFSAHGKIPGTIGQMAIAKASLLLGQKPPVKVKDFRDPHWSVERCMQEVGELVH